MVKSTKLEIIFCTPGFQERCDTFAPKLVDRNARRLVTRVHPPTTVSNECREKRDNKWNYCRRPLTACQRDPRSAEHDDRQSSSCKRCQFNANAENPGQDQSNRAQYFGCTDEMQEPTWQRNLLGHLFNRHNELHHAGEHKKSREQTLQDPKCHVHPAIGPVRCNGFHSCISLCGIGVFVTASQKIKRSSRQANQTQRYKRHAPERCLSCSQSAGPPGAAFCTSAGKSVNSCTGRTSMVSFSKAGQRVAHSIASSFDFTWIIQ